MFFSLSDAGTNSTALSSGSPSPQLVRHKIPPISLPRMETVASPQYQASQSPGGVSLTKPPLQIGYPSMDDRERREINSTNLGYEEVSCQMLKHTSNWR